MRDLRNGILLKRVVPSSWMRASATIQRRSKSSNSISLDVEGPEYQRQRLQDLLQVDRTSLFHPYTSLVKPLPTQLVEGANGCTLQLRLSDKTVDVIDGMSSWWAVIHGYNVPEINAAIQNCTDQHLCHVMFGGLTHQPAIDLANTLLPLLPNNLTKLFYACSGSVAVEVALKLALQYQMTTTSDGKKHKIIAVRGGYHGDTLGAMSVSDPDNGLHQQFFAPSLLPNIIRAEKPTPISRYAGHCDMVTSVESILQKQGDEIAALIVEPLIQGAGGMNMYSPQALRDIRELTRQHNVLLIVDEIATGFGRTYTENTTNSGKLFASQQADVEPDILCAGKALTGGYCSLGVVALSDQVGMGLGPDYPFMHGPTFMGNPLACSIANASIQLLTSSPWQKRISSIEAQLKKELSNLSILYPDLVHDVRVLGAIGVVELQQPIANMAHISKIFIEQGVWIRPFGKLLYVMPPYTISQQQLTQLTSTIRYVLQNRHVIQT